MTSWNGNIFRVIGPLWGESSGFPSQRPATRSFNVSFDVRLNKRLSKQSRCWWFETPWRSLWRHGNEKVFADTLKVKKMGVTFLALNLEYSVGNTRVADALASCPCVARSSTANGIDVKRVPIVHNGPFCCDGLTLIPAWTRNYTPGKVLDEITYPFPNFSSYTVEVWKWISNFILHFLMYVTAYPCRD